MCCDPGERYTVATDTVHAGHTAGLVETHPGKMLCTSSVVIKHTYIALTTATRGTSCGVCTFDHRDV